MKPKTTYALVKAGAFLVVILTSVAAFAQTAPKFRFKNSSLVSGTAGQLNATYRFPNVTTSGANMDALVKIQAKVGNITLINIDRTLDGYNEAFQPEYSIAANSTGYFEFLITFVQAGTNTVTAQPNVEASGLDIDGTDTLGYQLKEFNRIDMGGGICSFNLLGSQLTLSHPGTAYDGNNFTGILFGALVDTSAKEVMFSVSNANVSTFVYRVGATSAFPAAMNRYASLYFMKFNYPQNVILSVNNLSSFTGVASNNKNNLKWSLVGGNDASNVILEKSSNGTSFEPVTQFWVNVDGNTQKDFNYTDDKAADRITYYRLKIASKQGNIEYSNILRLSGEVKNMSQLNVFPSLVQSTATVNYTSREKQIAVINVTDMSGRLMKQQNILLQAGANSIQVSGFDQYQKGNYFVSLATATEKSSKQVIVN